MLASARRFFCYTISMTDENSVAPPDAPEPASEPQSAVPAAAPEVAAPAQTTPVLATEPAIPEPAVVPAEAINEISEVITEAVQDAMTHEAPEPTPPSAPTPQPPASNPLPEPPQAAPAASSASSQPPPAPKKSSRPRMLEIVRARKAARLEKILVLAAQKGTVTNDDVQLLLNVSDSTAARYLKQLAVTGRLTATGKRGHIRYEAV